MLSSGKVWAFSGGPFDNGDPGGILMERASFYQCQFSFRNGNGYGFFTPDAQLAGAPPGMALGGGSAGLQQGSSAINIFDRGNLFTDNTGDLSRNANRSVFYYKGITYVGACFGFVDADARKIQGMANATSNDALTQQSLVSAGTGGGGGVAGLTQQTTRVVINNSGFIINLGWEGKISSTRPILRFRGKGEMAVSAPTGQATITSLAFRAYSGLIDAIVSSAQNNQGGGGGGLSPAIVGAIELALTNLEARIQDGSGSPDQLYEETEKQPVQIRGSRRFF